MIDSPEAGLAAGGARAEAPAAELRRGIGLPAAVALVISGTVGRGRRQGSGLKAPR